MSLRIGIHDGVRAADYHADCAESPSLSSSLAKVLIDATPRHAWTAHPKLNPDFEHEEDSKFDMGSVVHEMILGAGGGFMVVDAADWRTKIAQEQRNAARAEGATALLRQQANDAAKMTSVVFDRLSAIEEARPLFGSRGSIGGLVNGRPERVLIWRDVGGALCRSMIDWQGPSETEIWDLKTTAIRLNDDSIQKQIINLGYDLSAAFYLRGLSQLKPELAGRFRFRWVFVEAEAPFEVRVVEPSAEMLEMGDRKAALAIEKWRRCLSANEWPGYAPTVTRVESPTWATDRWLAREQTDDDALNFRPLSRAGVQPPPAILEPV